MTYISNMTKFVPQISSFSLSLKRLYLATFVESVAIAYCDSLVATFLTVAIKKCCNRSFVSMQQCFYDF